MAGGVAPAILTFCGGGLEHKMLVIERIDGRLCSNKTSDKRGDYPLQSEGGCDLAYPHSQTRRGRVIEEGMVSPTIMAEDQPSVLEPWVWELDGVKYRIRIRKITPRECFRLMNFSDEDYEKASAVCSYSQLYKQAGNAIVRNVLVGIFGQMIPGCEDKYKDVKAIW